MTPSAKTAGGRRVRRWTRELIIEKILEWDARYGEPPCSADWNPSLARWRAQEWRAERYREGVWPSTNAAKRPFDGSFDAAVRAAGLEPHRPGPRRGAGEARPVLEQRAAPARPRRAGDRLDRARRAEARAAALERELLVAEGRAERAEAKSADARRRARRASEQAGRARRARERVRVAAATPAPTRSSASKPLIADADARVRARRRPGRGRGARRRRGAPDAAAAAERRARELSALVADGQRRLTGRGAERAASGRAVRPGGAGRGALRRLAEAARRAIAAACARRSARSPRRPCAGATGSDASLPRIPARGRPPPPLGAGPPARRLNHERAGADTSASDVRPAACRNSSKDSPPAWTSGESLPCRVIGFSGPDVVLALEAQPERTELEADAEAYLLIEADGQLQAVRGRIVQPAGDELVLRLTDDIRLGQRRTFSRAPLALPAVVRSRAGARVDRPCTRDVSAGGVCVAREGAEPGDGALEADASRSPATRSSPRRASCASRATISACASRRSSPRTACCSPRSRSRTTAAAAI